MKLYQTESGLYVICDGSVVTDNLTVDELIDYLKDADSINQLEFYQYTLGEEDKRLLTPDDIDKLVGELQERFPDSQLKTTGFIEVDWEERSITLYSVDPHDISNDRRFHTFYRYGDNCLLGVTVLDTEKHRAYYRYCLMPRWTKPDGLYGALPWSNKFDPQPLSNEAEQVPPPLPLISSDRDALLSRSFREVLRCRTKTAFNLPNEPTGEEITLNEVDEDEAYEALNFAEVYRLQQQLREENEQTK